MASQSMIPECKAAAHLRCQTSYFTDTLALPSLGGVPKGGGIGVVDADRGPDVRKDQIHAVGHRILLLAQCSSFRITSRGKKKLRRLSTEFG